MYGWAAVVAVPVTYNTWALITGHPMMSEEFLAWFERHPVQGTLVLATVSGHLTKRPRWLFSRVDPLTFLFGSVLGRLVGGR